jgi:hypothetical protein
VVVDITWPGSGTRQQLKNLEMDHGYRVIEGDPKPQPMILKTFKFATDNPHAHHHH